MAYFPGETLARTCAAGKLIRGLKSALSSQPLSAWMASPGTAFGKHLSKQIDASAAVASLKGLAAVPLDDRIVSGEGNLLVDGNIDEQQAKLFGELPRPFP